MLGPWSDDPSSLWFRGPMSEEQKLKFHLDVIQMSFRPMVKDIEAIVKRIPPEDLPEGKGMLRALDVISRSLAALENPNATY